MITLTVYKRQNQYQGFASKGHAGFAEEGEDTICAGVSALTVNAVNSIEQFTGDAFAVRQDEGFLELMLEGAPSRETTLLLDSMVLGIQSIQETYGNEYIQIVLKEV